MGTRNRVINVNSVNLAAVVGHHVGLPIVQLEAEPTDTVGNYVRQLRDSPAGDITALITMSRNTDDFPPSVTQSKVEIAAHRLGFRRIREFTVPDGLRLWVWGKRAGKS